MWWSIPLAVLAFILWVIIPVTIDYLSGKKKEKNMSKISEIYDMQEEGFCDSCDYGLDRCLTDGQAFCKKDNNNKEKEQNDENFI